MDPDVLSYPAHLIPSGVAPQLWLRWLKGTRAFDDLWGQGQRCPKNPAGARCRCSVPGPRYCQIWTRLEELGRQIGGVEAEIVAGMD